MIHMSVGEYLREMDVTPEEMIMKNGICKIEADDIFDDNTMITDLQAEILENLYGRSPESWKYMQELHLNAKYNKVRYVHVMSLVDQLPYLDEAQLNILELAIVGERRERANEPVQTVRAEDM